MLTPVWGAGAGGVMLGEVNGKDAVLMLLPKDVYDIDAAVEICVRCP